MSVQDIIAQAPRTRIPFWDAEADELLICRQVRDETHDVRTFVFAAREARLFSYKPGQFLTFEFEIGGQRINRCYTIASAPTRPYLISITVKRVKNGPVSNWLHDNLRPGMEVRAVGPMGDFTCAAHPARKYLFLSGGSGITPLMSMSRSHDDLGSDADIVFVHSARSPADIIFRDEIALMARQRPGFRATAVCEADSPGERWDGVRGRLSLPMLSLIAPDFREREVFSCGPGPYMTSVRAILAQAGFDMAHYHQESFDFEELTAAAQEASPATPKLNGTHFTIQFTKSRRDVECSTGTFVLDAARSAGMRLPSSCTKGMCGTCKSKLVSGTVEMQHAGGIRQREIDQGMILLCCARPTSNLVIER
jgi:glycine betaine catabolism B